MEISGHRREGAPLTDREGAYAFTVDLELAIAEDGTVRQARVVTTAGILDQAAVNTVMQWRFAPTVVNGVPTAVRGLVAVLFR